MKHIDSSAKLNIKHDPESSFLKNSSKPFFKSSFGLSFQKSKFSVYSILITYFTVFFILLPVILFSIGFRLDELIPVLLFEHTSFVYIGWALLLSGSVILTSSMILLLKKGKGLPISHLPPKHLVVSGFYKYFKHPIYLGYALIFEGISLTVNSFWSGSLSFSLLVFGTVGYIKFYEEVELINNFGESYISYKKSTSRLQELIELFKVLYSDIISKICIPLNYFAGKTILYRKNNLIIVTYGALISVGAFIYYQYSALLFIKSGVPIQNVNYYNIISTLIVLFFARFFWWAGNYKELSKEKIFAYKKIGFVSWGGYLGLWVSLILFAKFYQLNILYLSDILSRSIPIIYIIGRLGCITYGCCYGLKSHNIGIQYKHPESKVNREKGYDLSLRYPTQLYSMFIGILLFIMTNLLAVADLSEGLITALSLIVYAILRSIVEFYRDRKIIIKGVITEGHIGCLIIFIVGWLILVLLVPDEASVHTTKVTWELFVDSLSMIPVNIIASLLVLIIMGIHWKKIGTW